MVKHKSLKVSKKVQVPFSEKEVNDLFDFNNFPNNFEGIRDRLVVEIFYTTGIRKSELRSDYLIASIKTGCKP